ncbi:hypothetical protein, partial [Thauera butanivorans]|uniref:hypothetical protein n=1 Tax=Thauera butanivorans TaxID=86174 RepID=UPI000B313D68
MKEQIRAERPECGPYQEILALFGAGVDVQLTHEMIRIKPLTMRDLPVFMQWYSRSDFSGEGEVLPDVAHANARVIEMLTGRSLGWLDALAEDEFRGVVKAAIEANPTLFERVQSAVPRDLRGADIAAQGNAIQLSIARLVEAGHSLQDIQGYTLQQVDILCRAHARLAEERQINALVASRGGQVDAASFRRLIDQLKRDLK